MMLETIPFYSDSGATIVRAEFGAGGLRHWLEPQYHSKPVSTGGLLVFTDFGWDIAALFEHYGFARVEAEVSASDAFGHLGCGPIVLKVAK